METVWIIILMFIEFIAGFIFGMEIMYGINKKITFELSQKLSKNGRG